MHTHTQLTMHMDTTGEARPVHAQMHTWEGSHTRTRGPCTLARWERLTDACVHATGMDSRLGRRSHTHTHVSVQHAIRTPGEAFSLTHVCVEQPGVAPAAGHAHTLTYTYSLPHPVNHSLVPHPIHHSPILSHLLHNAHGQTGAHAHTMHMDTQCTCTHEH